MTRIAVVGATGAVGRTMLTLLRERDFPADEIVLFASARSAGTEIDGRVVQALDDDADLSGFDVALFSAGAAHLAGVGAAVRRRRAPWWSTTRRRSAATRRSRSSSPRSTRTRSPTTAA